MPADPAANPDPTPATDATDGHGRRRTVTWGPGPSCSPEERAVGSDDPAAQAEAILAESQERTEHPDPTPAPSRGTPPPRRPPAAATRGRHRLSGRAWARRLSGSRGSAVTSAG